MKYLILLAIALIFCVCSEKKEENAYESETKPVSEKKPKEEIESNIRFITELKSFLETVS